MVATVDRLFIGIDVGSTTVKAVVVNPTSRAIVWQDYRRHHARQAELVNSFLKNIRAAFTGYGDDQVNVFMTGSGAEPVARQIGGRMVQEVNAVSMAVEHLYPRAGSVIELGGQDAKIIIIKTDPQSGDRQVMMSMNDKCASGTGATIDKCLINVALTPDEISALRFSGNNLHHVSTKCGVFAETDVVNLVKSGVPAREILCSLADAIVMQNLSVLSRGNTLRHQVLLLGGPNTYLAFLRDCWRLRIPETWGSRNYEYPRDVPLNELIFLPPNAVLFAAYGAVLYGLLDESNLCLYQGETGLELFIKDGRRQQLESLAGPPLVAGEEELRSFVETYRVPDFRQPAFESGQTVSVYLGLDGGSTSSKAVMVGQDGKVLLKEYQLSRGNPIQDMKILLGRLERTVSRQGACLRILGFGVTGYAADVIDSSLKADVNMVETVAHMNSALHYFDRVDVVCDIGGQDIKVLMLHNRELTNFRLSNQCSAGNGMLLQAMADQFGTPVSDYAELSFSAQVSAQFSCGCAVFLDSDRVNLQKEGFGKEELMAGLAMVLPKNIWQYVVQVPRLDALGRHYVLQGGTQYNLAAVKAQVDYIRERVPDAEIMLHPHPGEAGAIGAALGAKQAVDSRGFSTFVGMAEAVNISYNTRNDETTRCNFCPNKCARTFIDTRTRQGACSRYISGFCCEQGTVEDKRALKALQRERRRRASRVPNLVAYEAKLCFSRFYQAVPLPAAGDPVDESRTRQGLLSLFTIGERSLREFARSSRDSQTRRKTLRVAIPRVLDIWSTAPFWRIYFETLGIQGNQIVFSDETSECLFRAGGRYGSTDPCFPGKVAQAHIHNILFEKHSEARPVQIVYFPTITHLPTFVANATDSACCPVAAGTPNVVKAAFTKEVDFFAQRNITFIDDAVTMNEPELLKLQLYRTWGTKLDVTRDESDFAVDQGWKALDLLDRKLQSRAREILEQLEDERKIGILLLGRPYHNDPGINHEIAEEFQALGYPILSIRSIPKDKAWLSRYFTPDPGSELTGSPLEIADVWPENYSTNSGQKVWAAKFAAHHPNIAVVDLSSFKCGHDAPIYGLIDDITGTAGVPFCAFHDLDATKPFGTIRMRVRTFAYSLRLREEALKRARDGQYSAGLG